MWFWEWYTTIADSPSRLRYQWIRSRWCSQQESLSPNCIFLKRKSLLNERLIFNLSLLSKINPDDLKTKINYFLFHKFTKENIGSILRKFPQLFSLKLPTIDENIAALGEEYALNPKEIRHVIQQYPKIVTLNQVRLKVDLFFCTVIIFKFSLIFQEMYFYISWGDGFHGNRNQIDFVTLSDSLAKNSNHTIYKLIFYNVFSSKFRLNLLFLSL